MQSHYQNSSLSLSVDKHSNYSYKNVTIITRYKRMFEQFFERNLDEESGTRSSL